MVLWPRLGKGARTFPRERVVRDACFRGVAEVRSSQSPRDVPVWANALCGARPQPLIIMATDWLGWFNSPTCLKPCLP